MADFEGKSPIQSAIQNGHHRYYGIARQNQTHATAISVQFVPGMRLLEFDHAVYNDRLYGNQEHAHACLMQAVWPLGWFVRMMSVVSVPAGCLCLSVSFRRRRRLSVLLYLISEWIKLGTRAQ